MSFALVSNIIFIVMLQLNLDLGQDYDLWDHVAPEHQWGDLQSAQTIYIAL